MHKSFRQQTRGDPCALAAVTRRPLVYPALSRLGCFSPAAARVAELGAVCGMERRLKTTATTMGGVCAYDCRVG